MTRSAHDIIIAINFILPDARNIGDGLIAIWLWENRVCKIFKGQRISSRKKTSYVGLRKKNWILETRINKTIKTAHKSILHLPFDLLVSKAFFTEERVSQSAAGYP
jgi:hypothetical protein